MHDLIIDTSTATCSLSLFNDNILIAYYHEHIGRGHAEVVIPQIQKIMDGNAPDRIFVNVGPGSFTGIRIGISAARALSLAWGSPCQGYSGMQLMAAIGLQYARDNIIKTNAQNAIDVIMSGGHGEFYMQSFDAQHVPINDVQSLSPIDCRSLCKAPLRIGDKAGLVDHDDNVFIINNDAPDTRLFRSLEPFNSIDVKPLYVRPPDAKVSAKAPDGNV